MHFAAISSNDDLREKEYVFKIINNKNYDYKNAYNINSLISANLESK